MANRVLLTAILIVAIANPALASWWIVRASDGKRVVVDIEPAGKDKSVTKVGAEAHSRLRHYQSWSALPREKWLDLNRKYSAIWPNITRKKPAPPDADEFVGVPDKFAKYFSPNPGEGD